MAGVKGKRISAGFPKALFGEGNPKSGGRIAGRFRTVGQDRDYSAFQSVFADHLKRDINLRLMSLLPAHRSPSADTADRFAHIQNRYEHLP
jgi:hypothetical protein